MTDERRRRKATERSTDRRDGLNAIPTPRIVLVGVGGAGANCVRHTADSIGPDVEMLVVDSSRQALAGFQRWDGERHPVAGSGAAVRLRGGSGAAGSIRTVLLDAAGGGRGTGGDRAVGQRAAEMAADAIGQYLAHADLVFVVAGLAGGTGGGAGPEVARMASATGAMTVGFGILPFGFEPRRSHVAAEEAAGRLHDACDATVPVDNRRAAAVAADEIGLEMALRVANDVVRQAVQGVTQTFGARARGQGIRIDFAQVCEVLEDAGTSCVALGACPRSAASSQPATDALEAALASPLCDMRRLRSAQRVMVLISAGPSLTLTDVDEATRRLREVLPDGCRPVVGVTYRDGLEGSAHVVLWGTGVDRVAADRTDEDPFDRAGAVHGSLAASSPNGWEPLTSAQSVPIRARQQEVV